MEKQEVVDILLGFAIADARLKRRVNRAVAYPAILTVMSLALLAFAYFRVLPEMKPLCRTNPPSATAIVCALAK